MGVNGSLRNHNLTLNSPITVMATIYIFFHKYSFKIFPILRKIGSDELWTELNIIKEQNFHVHLCSNVMVFCERNIVKPKLVQRLYLGCISQKHRLGLLVLTELASTFVFGKRIPRTIRGGVWYTSSET